MIRLPVSIALMLVATPASALTANQWDNAGTAVEVGLVAGAFGLSAARHDWTGVKQFGMTLGAAGGTAWVLKQMVNEPRPDGSGNDSFPSGHTTIAFAAAGYMHARYGWQIGLPAALAASFVGFTRVESNQHNLHDVVAGAAIGEVAAWLLTDRWNDDVQILPWGDTKGGGVEISARF